MSHRTTARRQAAQEARDLSRASASRSSGTKLGVVGQGKKSYVNSVIEKYHKNNER